MLNEGSPYVSVVICTRDRAESIADTLDSILRLDYLDYELLVIDQSKGPETRRVVESVRRHLPRLRYMQLARAGLSRAYNVGIKEGRGELLAFTDDDVVVRPDWLRNIVSAFNRYPGAALLYGQVLHPPELLRRENLDGVTPAFPIAQRRLLDREHGFELSGMGADFAARRSLFDRIGGFDEVLGGGGPLQSSQDFDLMYRAFKAGESTLMEPDVVVYHYGFRSCSGEWQATMRSYGIGVGGFLIKHVRMGDPDAVLLLLRFLGRATGRVVKRWFRGESAGVNWTFLTNMMTGIYQSFRFPIDHDVRMYRPQP